MQELFTEHIPAGVVRRGNVIISFKSDEVSEHISQCLQGEGFGVYMCKTFAEFMEIEHEDVRCVIVDVTAGHRSTFHAIEIIKQSPEGVNMPLLVVADGASTTSVVRALNVGANDYILQPHTDKAFIERVNKVIAAASK